MSLSPLDDPILAGVFVSDEVAEIFSTTSWLGQLLRVESALAQAQAEAGVIRSAAAEAIAAVAVDDLDVDTLRSRARIVGFPVVGLVEQLADVVPDGLGHDAHWGATTQDILDTALVLQLRDALAVLDRDLTATGTAMADLAQRHRTTVMIGRSQLQPGAPTTFGLRVAEWLSGVVRHLQRVDQLRPRLLAMQLSGAVGTAAAFGVSGPRVQRRTAELLDLDVAPVNWHTQRDTLAEAAQLAAMIAGSLGKIGLDVVLGSQFEVGELREGAGAAGAGTSSTMPQKRNPILAQRLMHAARLTRALAGTMLESQVADNDRGTGVWPTEWVVLPQLVALATSAAGTARHLLEHLQVNTARMASNAADVGDPLMAEAAMMALASTIGRQRAHDVLADAVPDAGNGGLAAALRRQGFTIDASAFDPAEYLGTAGIQVDAAIAAFTRVR